MNALELNGIETRIGRYNVLHEVSFTVPEGGVFVLLGRNGAGKTTTLRTIMGFWTPHAGSVRFRDTEISGLHTSVIARKGVAFVPEDMGIFRALTVAENMTLATARGQFDSARLDWIFDLFPALKTFWNTAAGGLSGGQKQMLAVARAIIEPRALILIDEPTKGLAPAIVDAMAEAFQEIARDTTILLVEQNFEFARALGRDMAVIEDGRIVHTGSIEAFAEDTELQTRLLSLSV
ncbi:ABC transporter ATP-binding protein [Thioclava indica]|uniref:ABC transporter domain-containing protein n=1 Tax=Thioclava indica TaxID=1353528 RepID=A0A074JC95_9RHOB|nr:ABC transporter ATP-binding protein [Thioclava indica]KEO53198.1 hypothetical protein DT23_07575 [Thioclava indica]